MTLITERLAALETLHLMSGAHESPEAGMCAMKAVAWIAGEPWSDRPECVCPVIGAFVRSWNDDLPDDERDTILKPILPRLIGTRGSDALAERRSLMAADWLIRTYTPAWLRLAKLDAHADALAALPEITSVAQIPSVRDPIKAAQRAASAACAAAGASAGASAAACARAAAGAAAAGAAAWDAASACARAAAVAAAVGAVNDTRLVLQRSAAELVNRMIDVKDAA